MIGTLLFTQIGLDSGALTLLGSVVHPVPEPGIYRLVVNRDGREVGELDIEVTDGGAAQLDVDLSSVGPGASKPARGGCCGSDDVQHDLRPGGHLLLHVGEGPGRYSAALFAVGDDKGRPVLDTTLLGPGDTFAATVLRPGRYRVTAPASGAEAVLVVRYPVRGKEPYRPADPIQVTVGNGFDPKELEIGPAQGIAFHVTSSARIEIALVEPDDGPA
jgi:hypothetical protein